MGDMMGLLDALQNTMVSLDGSVVVVGVAARSHTDMITAIDGRFDQLFGLVQGLHATWAWCLVHHLWGRWSCRR
jgi:hypothetical protein